MIDDKVFFDTNILVYSRDSSAGEKSSISFEILTSFARADRTSLSVQVIAEYYKTVVFKLSPGRTPQDARKDIEFFFSLKPELTDQILFFEAIRLIEKYKCSYWDAFIIAAAIKAKCRYLISEDLQDGQKFGTVEILNPFKPERLAFLEL